MWPFKEKPDPKPIDMRDWNEDWQVGDIAECMAGLPGYPDWNESIPPWQRSKAGDRFVVTGFHEGESTKGRIEYWLKLADSPFKNGYATTRAFRKVRPITKQESEIVERILNAPAGPDRVREVS